MFELHKGYMLSLIEPYPGDDVQQAKKGAITNQDKCLKPLRLPTFL
jgi:hypothetical protein